MGGGRFSNCSILEAIETCEEITGRKINWEYVQDNRKGDHIWYVTDLTKFKTHFPSWKLTYDTPTIIGEIYEQNLERWAGQTKVAVV